MESIKLDARLRGPLCLDGKDADEGVVFRLRGARETVKRIWDISKMAEAVESVEEMLI